MVFRLKPRPPRHNHTYELVPVKEVVPKSLKRPADEENEVKKMKKARAQEVTSTMKSFHCKVRGCDAKSQQNQNLKRHLSKHFNFSGNEIDAEFEVYLECACQCQDTIRKLSELAQGSTYFLNRVLEECICENKLMTIHGKEEENSANSTVSISL